MPISIIKMGENEPILIAGDSIRAFGNGSPEVSAVLRKMRVLLSFMISDGNFDAALHLEHEGRSVFVEASEDSTWPELDLFKKGAAPFLCFDGSQLLELYQNLVDGDSASVRNLLEHELPDVIASVITSEYAESILAVLSKPGPNSPLKLEFRLQKGAEEPATLNFEVEAEKVAMLLGEEI